MASGLRSCDPYPVTGIQVVPPSAGDTQFYAYDPRVEWTADDIRQARDDRGWSQLELAEELSKHVKTSVRSITDWETGKARPSGRRRAALDRVLGGVSTGFNPRAILAELTDDEVAELLAHVDDMAIVATVARRFARTERPVRHVPARSWSDADAPPISPDDEAGDEQQA